LTAMSALSFEELQAGLEVIRQSPADEGRLALIVRRPGLGQREVLAEGELNLAEGLAGDSWNQRPSARMPDRSPHPDMQLTLMNTRVIALLAQREERWPLAGDQLYVDLDLSEDNLPPGTRLSVGTALIEITAQPHTGCEQFKERFGLDGLKFVSTTEGRQLRLRGVNAKVIQAGAIRVGDVLRKA